MWLRREGEASAKGHRECSQRVTAESARGEERAHDRWPPVTTAAVRGRKSWASHRRNVASFKAGHITVLRPRTPATRTPGQHGEKEKKKKKRVARVILQACANNPLLLDVDDDANHAHACSVVADARRHFVRARGEVVGCRPTGLCESLCAVFCLIACADL